MNLWYFQLAASTDSGIGTQIADWAVRIIETLGGPGAALLIALENLFPPLPSELILPLTGFGASRGDLSLIGAIAWTTAGSLVGALVLYQIGAVLGRDRLRSIATKIPLIKISDIDKTENWFARHETQTVFWGRMIPIFRSLISIPAGIERMPLRQFVIYTAAGSLIWNTTLIYAGFLLGEQWERVSGYVQVFQYLVIIAVIAVVTVFVVRRLRTKRTTTKQ